MVMIKWLHVVIVRKSEMRNYPFKTDEHAIFMKELFPEFLVSRGVSLAITFRQIRQITCNIVSNQGTRIFSALFISTHQSKSRVRVRVYICGWHCLLIEASNIEDMLFLSTRIWCCSLKVINIVMLKKSILIMSINAPQDMLHV